MNGSDSGRETWGIWLHKALEMNTLKRIRAASPWLRPDACWILLIPCMIGLSVLPVAGQALADHFTGRYGFERMGAATQMGDFEAPLKKVASLPISGTPLLSFEDRVLVGAWDYEHRLYAFSLYDLEAKLLWSTSFQRRTHDSTTPLPTRMITCSWVVRPPASRWFVPRPANCSGRILESGRPRWRSPIVTGRRAYYHGTSGIRAVAVESGELLWSIEAETAEAPLVLSGEQLFVSLADGRLVSIDPSNGEIVWSVEVFSVTDLMASEGRVYLLDQAISPYVGFALEPSRFAVLDAANGTVLWQGADAKTNAMALSRDRLFFFRTGADRTLGGGCYPCLQARAPETGEVLWEDGYTSYGTLFDLAIWDSVVINDTIFTTTDLGLFAWKATSGEAVWLDGQVFGGSLSASQGRLLVRDGDSIAVFVPDLRLNFAQLANGQGQSTLLVLSNPGRKAAQATVHFLDEDGSPLKVPLVGRESASDVDLVIAAGESRAVETSGGETLQVGWVSVESDRVLEGSSIFRYRAGEKRYEAGVAPSRPSNRHASYINRVDRFETAVALVNPHSQPISVDVELVGENPGYVKERFHVDLGPGAHRAFFLTSEQYPELVTASVTAVSDNSQPFLMTVLRTRDGLQMSSYP